MKTEEIIMVVWQDYFIQNAGIIDNGIYNIYGTVRINPAAKSSL